MRLWSIGLSVMMMVAGCDKHGPGSEGSGEGPSNDGPSNDGPADGGQPSTSTTSGGGSGTTGVDTEGCGSEDTAADPWGDGCGDGLPTQSPYDVGNGGNCWFQSDQWNTSCEEEPCLDYDCHTPSPCGPVTFGECDDGPSGSGSGSGSASVGDATTGGSELEVDDPAALECILEALRDQVPIRYTIIDCDASPTSTTTYEVVSNGLVITTLEEAWGTFHDRHQEITTFNDDYDFASCVGAGVENWEKRWCTGMAGSAPCPVGPVACPGE